MVGMTIDGAWERSVGGEWLTRDFDRRVFDSPEKQASS